MVYVTHDQTEAMTLGDRVAVMRSGVIQQVDSPKVLYHDPKNLFVAGFIGSPAMNFLPARLEDGVVKLPFGDAPIPPGHRRAPKREVIAGIRPEHFDDARLAGPDAPGLRFRTKVAVVESLGSEEFVFFDVNAHARGGRAARAWRRTQAWTTCRRTATTATLVRPHRRGQPGAARGGARAAARHDAR